MIDRENPPQPKKHLQISRSARAKSSALSVLLAAAAMLSYIIPTARSTAEPGSPGQGLIIGMVAGYPKSNNTLLLDELRKRCKGATGLDAVRFEYTYTMDDPAEVDKLLKRYRSQTPDFMIYLDRASASSYADQIAVPCLAIASARSVVVSEKGRFRTLATQSSTTVSQTVAASTSRLSTWLIETTPQATLIAKILAGLNPVPATIGIAYIKGDASHEKFLDDLDHALAGKLSSPPLRCALPPASCNNANAIQAILQATFVNLARGGIMIVLPGNNTLKFPFVFDQFAEKQQLVLVGLGDFDESGVQIHVGCSPATLAETCLDILSQVLAQKTQISPMLVAPRQQLRWNKERLGKAGYVVNTAQLHQLPELVIAEDRQP